MNGSAWTAVIMGAGLLVLNWAAFRSAARSAGHGKRQMLQMAAVWLTIIAVLTFLITRFQS